MGFAYFGHNWAFHGVYIFGLSLIFFAGVLLVIALWPWKKEYYQPDKTYARTKKGVDIERVAFFATALTTVISALFGAIPGSFFGNGFDVFLAENVIRLPEKTTMQYSIIGHLHIMLALIAIMITIESPIRINHDPIFIFQPDRDFFIFIGIRSKFSNRILIEKDPERKNPQHQPLAQSLSPQIPKSPAWHRQKNAAEENKRRLSTHSRNCSSLHSPTVRTSSSASRRMRIPANEKSMS